MDLFNKMQMWTTGAMMSLMMSLVFCVILLVSLNSTSFRGPAETCGKINSEMFHAWWLWMRIPMLISTFCCIAGVAMTFSSFAYIYILKAPDFSCQNVRRHVCWNNLSLKSPWGAYQYAGWIVLVGGAFFGGLLIASLALTFKSRQYVDIQRRERLAIQSNELYGYLKACCEKAHGIPDIWVKQGAFLLKELGYNIESLLNEFDFIDWEDIPGFPVRVKYCLKMKIHGNDELRATDASYLSLKK